MKTLIIISIIIGLACGQTGDHDVNQDVCGRRPIVDNLIVGGDESKNGGHPYIVSIEYSSTLQNFQHTCGGSLINNRWILTAAHCINIRNIPNYYRIQIGAHNRSPGSQNTWQATRTIDKIILHPSYGFQTFKNDVALLRLTTRVEFDDKYIIPTCLYDGTEQLSDNQIGIAAGWGSTSTTGSVQNILREVELPLTPNKTCSDHYVGFSVSYDPISMICFGQTGDDKDTCSGDSGGTVITKLANKWKQIGITSWGKGCGDIGVYVRVNNFVKWIKDTIAANQNSPGK